MSDSPLRILVVDDSRFSRVMAADPLENAGFQVAQAADGQEGLDAVESFQPHCVVTDLLMPNMDGFEMIRQLRQRQWHQPIVVVSADIQETSRSRCDEMNVFGFLNKPLKADQLLEVVQRAVQVTEGELV